MISDTERNILADYVAERGHTELADMIAHHPFWRIGEAYYIRCAVYSVLGRLVYGDERELVLETASYVGTDGRYSEAVSNGMREGSAEIEYAGVILVNRAAISDATRYNHELPTHSF